MSDDVEAWRKNDGGKPRFELLDGEFLEELALVMGDGADKYEDFGWKPEVSEAGGWGKYVSAMFRHAVAVLRGEAVDPDSGYTHMGHIAANAMILHWRYCRRQQSSASPSPPES